MGVLPPSGGQRLEGAHPVCLRKRWDYKAVRLTGCAASGASLITFCSHFGAGQDLCATAREMGYSSR